MSLKSYTEQKGNPVMVVGGGVAGIVAALDLANAGRIVHLVEKEPNLGGQVAKLDKLYPTDHCAFCPLWTEVRLCMQHPLITIHTLSFIKDIKKQGNLLHVVIVNQPHYIDEKRCIFCGRCAEKCPANAIKSAGEHSYPPFYVIDAEPCTWCGLCEDICPTAAIDMGREKKEIIVAVEHLIWATGFQDADISTLEEYGHGTHPDIMTSLEFEDWTAEAGQNMGTIITRRNHSIPERIAFIQCAGARDKRMFPYCSAVCCMHALKQARWVKRRNPFIETVIFYTDLRIEGRHYYEYYLRETKGFALELIRGRPGLIYPLPSDDGIAVKYEDTQTQTREIRKFDMVVLNGALAPSLSKIKDLSYIPRLDREGFLRKSEENSISCGFCREPGDVEASAVQASSAAMRVCLGEKANGKR